MSILVLSGSYQETNAFARSQELGYGIHHVVNKDMLKGHRRPTQVHVLPSWYKRRDIHSFNAELARIKRQNPKLEWVEYDKTADGRYVPQDDFEPVDPPVNPKKAPKVAKNSEGAVEPPAGEVDTGPHAVPGQIAVEEILAADPDTLIGPELQARDDFIDFLDS